MADLSLTLTSPQEARQALGRCLRVLRQRQEMTLPELASQAGVPASTLSRLERLGEGSMEAVTRALHVLNALESLQAWTLEQTRQAGMPLHIADLETRQASKARQRVRHRKGRPA